MKLRIISIGALVLLNLFLGREWMLLRDSHLIVRFLDVGQGDSALITTPSGKDILIDGGPDLTALSEIGHNLSLFDRDIDLLVLSHPHLDHLYSFPELLRRYRVKNILFTGQDTGLGAYQEFLTLVRDQHIPVIVANPTKDIDMGDGVAIDVLWPRPIYFGKNQEDANNSSVVLKVLYKDHSILFTGDMEEPEEAALLASGTDVKSDVLKVAHHGSRTSSSTGFLLAVDPDVAVISVGNPSPFGHPHTEIVERYKHLKIPIRQTAKEGTIMIQW